MLDILFLLFSGVLTVGIAVFAQGVNHLWLLPIWIGSYLALTALYLLSILLASYLLSSEDPVKKPSRGCMRMIFLTMDWLMHFFRVKVVAEGLENLPDKACVIVSNHISEFDPMVVLSVLGKRKIIYISKEQNFRIPIAGRFIHRAGYLAIDRENAMRAMRTLKRASDLIRDFDISVGIYPEGTRSRDGELHDFKEGAFYVAKRTNAPVAVLATSGTEKIRKNIFFRRTKVRIHFLGMMDSETVASMTLEELAKKSHDMIAGWLGETK